MSASTTKSHRACHHAHPSWFTHQQSIHTHWYLIAEHNDAVRTGRFFLSRCFPLYIVRRRQIITRIERIRLDITREIMSRNFWSLLCNIRHAYVNELMDKRRARISIKFRRCSCKRLSKDEESDVGATDRKNIIASHLLFKRATHRQCESTARYRLKYTKIMNPNFVDGRK